MRTLLFGEAPMTAGVVQAQLEYVSVDRFVFARAESTAGDRIHGPSTGLFDAMASQRFEFSGVLETGRYTFTVEADGVFGEEPCDFAMGFEVVPAPWTGSARVRGCAAASGRRRSSALRLHGNPSGRVTNRLVAGFCPALFDRVRPARR
ncbi:MAG: hypothetical protein AAF108_03500 [Planctomycetota bacterium]